MSPTTLTWSPGPLRMKRLTVQRKVVLALTLVALLGAALSEMIGVRQMTLTTAVRRFSFISQF